jgi:hypothetical protein
MAGVFWFFVARSIPPVFYFAVGSLELLDKTLDPGDSEQLRAIQHRGFLDEIMPRMADLPDGSTSTLDFSHQV